MNKAWYKRGYRDRAEGKHAPMIIHSNFKTTDEYRDAYKSYYEGRAAAEKEIKETS